MSLDVTLFDIVPEHVADVFTANITHNLGLMADEAGIYQHLWHPGDVGIQKAGDLVAPLKAGLTLMEQDPERFKKFNPPNGWGRYQDFLPWIRTYIEACEQHPNATVKADR